MRLRFVDRVVSLRPRERVVVSKCVSFEETMLARPTATRGVPPTLLIEWLGQATAVLVAESTAYSRFPVVGGIRAVTFGDPLLAGDSALVTVDVRLWHSDAALVNGVVELASNVPPSRPALRVEGAVCPFVALDHAWDEAELRAAVRAARGDFPGPA